MARVCAVGSLVGWRCIVQASVKEMEARRPMDADLPPLTCLSYKALKRPAQLLTGGGMAAATDRAWVRSQQGDCAMQRERLDSYSGRAQCGRSTVGISLL